MKAKVKQFGNFIFDAVSSGWRGVIGLIVCSVSVYLLLQLFISQNNIIRYWQNSLKISAQSEKLADEESKITVLEKRIRLIQNHSPDYVEELAQRYLNTGNSKTKIIRARD